MNQIENREVIIIGGGPAGLAAAVKLRELGVGDILILERENQLGGILRQCIHDGFGLTRFQESLSGPEYAQRFIAVVEDQQIAYLTGTSVIQIGADKTVHAVSRSGYRIFRARAIILAMGCRERTRGAIGIPGSRPAGIYTAGVAQAYINLKNLMVGRRVAILGSGDIGMIMARRLTLEGATVLGVFELLPYASGLPRNVRQCLDDYAIPLHLSHTVTAIRGKSRLEGITVSRVDESLQPIAGTETDYCCDTLILSVGLIPENELSLMAGVELDPRTRGASVDQTYQTSVDGIYAAGNVLHVHDLVDSVSLEAERLAQAVCRHLRRTGAAGATGAADEFGPVGTINTAGAAGAASVVNAACGIGALKAANAAGGGSIAIETDEQIGYTVPQRISALTDFQLSLRVRRPWKNCRIQLLQNGVPIRSLPLRKAIPAEMIHIGVRRSDFLPPDNPADSPADNPVQLKVVLIHE